MRNAARLSSVAVFLVALLAVPGHAVEKTGAQEQLEALETLYQAARSARFAPGPKLEELESESSAFIETWDGEATPAQLAAARVYLMRCWLTAKRYEDVLGEAAAVLSVPKLGDDVHFKVLYYRGMSAVGTDDRELAESTVEQLMKIKPDIGNALRVAVFGKWAPIVVGETPPQWTLSQVPGTGGAAARPISLEKLRGKYLLLDFWATWCGPCKIVMEKELQPIHGTWRDDERFELISVGTPWAKDTAEKQAAYAKTKGYKWTKVFDADGAVTASYGVTGIPTLTFIGPDGKVIAHGFAEQVLPKVKKTLEGLDAG